MISTRTARAVNLAHTGFGKLKYGVQITTRARAPASNSRMRRFSGLLRPTPTSASTASPSRAHLAVVNAVLKLFAECAVVPQAARGRTFRQIEPVHGLRRHHPPHIIGHAVRKRGAMQFVVAVEAITVELLQVDVVQACAAIEHAIVEHKALQVQHAKQFTRVCTGTP